MVICNSELLNYQRVFWPIWFTWIIVDLLCILILILTWWCSCLSLVALLADFYSPWPPSDSGAQSRCRTAGRQQEAELCHGATNGFPTIIMILQLCQIQYLWDAMTGKELLFGGLWRFAVEVFALFASICSNSWSSYSPYGLAKQSTQQESHLRLTWGWTAGPGSKPRWAGANGSHDHPAGGWYAAIHRIGSCERLCLTRAWHVLKSSKPAWHKKLLK